MLSKPRGAVFRDMVSGLHTVDARGMVTKNEMSLQPTWDTDQEPSAAQHQRKTWCPLQAGTANLRKNRAKKQGKSKSFHPQSHPSGNAQQVADAPLKGMASQSSGREAPSCTLDTLVGQ
jgi:hypothetical protein